MEFSEPPTSPGQSCIPTSHSAPPDRWITLLPPCSDFDPKIGVTYSASTNFKAFIPLLLPSVPGGCGADVAVQVWLLHGCLHWCPGDSWTPLSSHRQHLHTHSLPGVTDRDTLAAAQPLLTLRLRFSSSGPLTNAKAIWETSTLRRPSHPNPTSGPGFKRWGLSKSPGLQLQGYCGRKGTTSPAFPGIQQVYSKER